MAEVIEHTRSVDKFKSDFEEYMQMYGSSDPLAALRVKAYAAFEKAGIPTTRNEEWKYTNIRPLIENKFSFRTASGKAGELPLHLLPEMDHDSALLVFTDGKFQQEYSKVFSEKNFIASPVSFFRNEAEVIRSFSKYASSFNALNAAMAVDGIFIKAGKNVEKNINVVHFSSSSSDSASCMRNIISVHANSRINISIYFISLNEHAAFVNIVTDITCAPDGEAIINLYQSENSETIQVNEINSDLGRNSRFTANTISWGGRLIRNNLNVGMNGENAEAHLNGFTIAGGNSLIDHHTFVDHAVPNCNSNELYKSLATEKGTVVFNGKIMVRQDAQKTNAFQENKNILLSDDANIFAKPQLEIFADDVKCSHGATTGQIDADALFYLRSRGLSIDQSRNLLIHAFASDVLNRVQDAGSRQFLEAQLTERLSKYTA